MKKFRSFTLLVFIISMVACSKKSSDRDAVFIRVENTTSENFSSFKLNLIEFGSINSGETTGYLPCGNVWPIPFANSIEVNGRLIYIADIAPTPYLKNGHYLMKVIPDSSSFRYTANFVTEY